MNYTAQNGKHSQNGLLDLFLLLIWSLFCLCLIFHRTQVWFDRAGGDTAFLAEVVENIRTNGSTQSIAAQSALRIIYGGFLVAKADQVERLGFQGVDESQGVLKAHAYLFLYLVGAFSHFIDIPLLLSTLLVVSFMGALLVCYLIIRGDGGSAPFAALFCAIVACHPFWRTPLYYGQDYVDRYFIGLGALLILCLYTLSSHNSWRRWCTLIVVYLTTCSLSERMALIAGALVLYQGILFMRTRTFNTALPCIGLGALGIMYACIQIKFILTAHSYSSFLSLHSFLHPIFLNDSVARAKTILFFTMSLPLLIPALRKPAWGFVALGSIIPNVFGTIGGAEKVGWATHYHSICAPVLITSAAIGIGHVHKILRYATLLLMAFVFIFVDQDQVSPLRISTNGWGEKIVVTWPWHIGQLYLNDNYVAIAQQQKKFDEAVPKGVVVSTPEFGMGRLIFGRTVYMFPTGIEKAQVILLSTCASPPPKYCGFPSYLEGAEKRELDQLMLNKMEILGFDLSHPSEIVPGVFSFTRK